jgi:FkbM family methyltransferase
MKKFVKNLMRRMPRLEGALRRHVLSRLVFPEAEMALIARSARPFDISVDVGAALGHYTWVLSRQSRRVFAFEPGPVHGSFLEKNVYASNITLVRAAVGAASGREVLNIPGEGEVANHTATISKRNPLVSTADVKTVEVDVLRVDDYFAEIAGIIDFIKIDVEGYENEVLGGAKNVLARHHPVILCEIELRHNSRADEFFLEMEDIGYAALYWHDGQFVRYSRGMLPQLQRDEDLQRRLSGRSGVAPNQYINNFLFFHPLSKFQLRDFSL